MSVLTSKSAFETLSQNPRFFAPLSVRVENYPPVAEAESPSFRINIQVSGKSTAFLATLIPSGILKDIELGILKTAKMKTEDGIYPLLVLPYISRTVQTRLEEEVVSAIDLSGNYYIVTSEFTAIRLDQQNRFKVKRTIQNIYSRNSSIAVRWLLTKKSVTNNLLLLKKEMNKAGSSLTLGTISKVLKVLEEDVFILRTPEEIKVLKPGELLTRLKNQYKKPTVLSELRIQLPAIRTEAQKFLNEKLGENQWIWSGQTTSSVFASAIEEEIVTIYTKNNPLNTRLARFSNDRFYNSTIQYILDPLVYFDSEDNFASPIQSYIELALLDKREQEIAEDIRRVILNEK